MSNSIVPEGRFWHGRRVFITGHTGFVGGWLAFWLAGLGARVAGYALPPPPGASLFETLGIGHRIDASVLADVRDLQSLAEAVERSRADVIFHLAAQPLVLAAHADPVGTFDTNVMGTVNLLEAARRAGSVSAVVVFTTDKVYENREGGRGYRESDALGGHEPYGLSKAAAELAVAAWRESFFRAPSRVGVATVRAGNIIGGGDWAPDRIVPDAVRAFAQGRTLILRHPSSVRPWQHVLDALRGMLVLVERLREKPESFSGAWNIGPDAEPPRTVGDLATQIAECWGQGASWEAGGPGTAKEATWLGLDSRKALLDLGWRPAWDFVATVERTVAWYQTHQQGRDMSEVSAADIDAHLAVANQEGRSSGIAR